MDRYTKAFVVASLVYFFLAAVLGVWMGVTMTAGVFFLVVILTTVTDLLTIEHMKTKA